MKRKPNGYWSKERCIKSASKHPTRIAWMRAQMPAYSAAHAYGWLDECCAHMKRLRAVKVSWTKKQCREKALGFSTRVAWSRGHHPTYRYAANMGWLRDCVRHMPPSETGLKWTPAACRKEAKRFSTRKEWREKSQNSYHAAGRYGILGELFKGQKSYRHHYASWTPKQLRERARKFKTRTAWFLGSNATYNVAKQKGCFEWCCAHMK